ncbi:MAG: HyaD/HybD family hydrogenase maturation endopeptidase [Deltaproteobacteria bacterium]|nr:HyaD/HybD family hydrogenase maturation endopeptidase [Deltaproteobacteria bacterium]
MPKTRDENMGELRPEKLRVLILGVGNLLLGDEGVGVHAVRKLEEEHAFPPEVRLLDGGTLGLRLMECMEECDFLLVLDAVRGGQSPGTLYRLEGEALRSSLGKAESIHQVDLADTLILCELSGKRPHTVVLGLEPENITDARPELSPALETALPKMCAAAVEEMRRLGLGPL